MRYSHWVMLVLASLLIATPSINSDHSSLPQGATISSYGTIQARFEIELLGTDDTAYLYNEPDIGVLGTVQQTPRYGVSGEAWADGVGVNSLFFDTTLSDRFIVECAEEKAISISSYAWVEWTAPVLEGRGLPQPDREFGKIIWEWDGTLEDIRSINSMGYLHNEDRMSLATIAGKHCVKFHEPDIDPKGGFDSVAITLYVREQYQPEYWAQISLYIPTSFDLRGGWWNVMSINQEYGGGEYYSDQLQVDEDSNGELEPIQVTGEPDETRHRTDYRIPRGQWVTIRVHVYKHSSNGFYKIWFDGVLIHDLANLENDWNLEDICRIRICAGYASGDAKRPFDLYFSDFVLATKETALY